MKYSTSRPYIASYVLVEKNGRIAFVHRENTSWMNSHYGLPSGKVEKDEDYLSAAVREAKEEIGIDVRIKDLQFVHVMHRHNEKEQMNWVDVFFKANHYEGKPYNAEPHLHSELAWFSLDELPGNTIPSVKFALMQIKAGEQFSQYGWN